MAANTSPIFTATSNISAATISAANTKSDGSGTIGTDIFKAFTADATNGSYVSNIRFSLTASVAATASTATVLRVFISNITSGATTNANTHLFTEVAVASQSGANSGTATYQIEIPINRFLPASWTILITSHAAPAANTVWEGVVYAGNY